MKQKKYRKTGEPAKTKDRILVFDIIRIVCVAIIVYDHSRYDFLPWFNQFFFPDGYGLFNIYSNGLQGYAVFGMILISGAVLEYNYRGLENLHRYLQFLFRRFIRLYPAFWMSLILGLFVVPGIWQNSIPSLLFEFTGFFVVLGLGPGNINSMGWFIAAIISLYLLFPLFSKIIRRYRMAALFGFCLISWGLRFLLLTYNLVPIDQFWRWFPLCNAFEFCLGISIVQTGLYPKNATTSPVIRKLADLTYYIFIFHLVVMGIFVFHFQEPVIALDKMMAMNNPYLGYAFYYTQIMGSVLVISWIAMILDTRIRNQVFERGRVKKFLRE